MKKSKLFILPLAIVLILNFSGFTYAKDPLVAQATQVTQNTKVSKDEAIKIGIDAFKKYFELEIDEKKYQSNCQLNSDYMNPGNSTWDINWYNNNGTTYNSVGITIDANTGKIQGMRKYIQPVGQSNLQVPKFSEADAKKYVENFIEKINPGLLKEAKLIGNPIDNAYGVYQNSYNFKYIRMINDIPFDNNSIDVQFDPVNGDISSYSMRWDGDLNFPKINGEIGTQKVLETYKKEIDFKLQYMASQGTKLYYQRPNPIKLIYVPFFKNNAALDAMTGEMIPLYPYENNKKTIDLKDNEKKELVAKYLSQAKSDKELDRVKAEEIITGMVKTFYGDGAALDSISYQQSGSLDNSSPNATWNGQFSIPNDTNFGGFISIDAHTGSLVNMNKNFYYGTNTEAFTPKISWEEAYHKAIDAISKYFKDKVKDINTEQAFYDYKNYYNGKEVPMQEYNFNFTRQINGIDYPENSISIGFDIKTGTLTRIYSNWYDDLKVAEVKNILGKADVSKTYFDNYKPTLSYVMINKSTDASKPDMQVKLVYLLKPIDDANYMLSGNMDAFSGKFLNFLGEEVKGNPNTFIDNIKDSKYKEEIKLLGYQGTIDMKTFDINKNLTKLDLLKILVNMKGYRYYIPGATEDLKFTNIKKDDENYKYLQMAVSLNLIKNESVELKLDETITREEMIKYLIDLTPYGKLAKAKDIFALGYTDAKDISTDKYGHIAIALGLSILDNSSSTLNPKGIIKMEEAAHLVFNTMSYVTYN